MRLATVQQAREMDQRTQREFGLSDELLMESAGALAAHECIQSYAPEVHAGRIAILCGPGNNGADGLVMTRHLISQLESLAHPKFKRSRVVVFVLAPFERRSPLFCRQLERLRLQGVTVISLEKTNAIYDRRAKNWSFDPDTAALESGDENELLPTSPIRLSDFSLWIDALYGIGFHGALDAHTAEWVKAINETKTRRASLDTPSGLDCDRGTVEGVAFRAERTWTFGCAKVGFTLNDGPEYSGHVRVLPIGFPPQILMQTANTYHYVTRVMARRWKPRRSVSANKTSAGHTKIFAGRDGMWGAGVLSSQAAYRVGSGYVSLVSHDDPSRVINQHPEILTQVVGDESIWADERWKAAAVGPGLGVSDATAALMGRLKTRSERGLLNAVVVDADAITVAAERDLFPLPESWIFTPHAGELARILRSSRARECLSPEDTRAIAEFKSNSALSQAIERDRIRYARAAAQVTGGWVLLKGFRTVVTHARQNGFWVIGAGNPALAKAGTGDVLTGLIAGLLSQGLSSRRAACLGAYLHGLTADEWLETGHDILSLESGDLIRRLPDTLSRL